MTIWSDKKQFGCVVAQTTFSSHRKLQCYCTPGTHFCALEFISACKNAVIHYLIFTTLRQICHFRLIWTKISDSVRVAKATSVSHRKIHGYLLLRMTFPRLWGRRVPPGTPKGLLKWGSRAFGCRVLSLFTESDVWLQTSAFLERKVDVWLQSGAGDSQNLS